MPRQIPKVYVNKIDKEIKNNDNIFYSREKKDKKEVKEIENLTKEEIKNRILKIFNSPNFVYKMDVQIITKDDKVLDKKLVAMVNDTLLTLDEERIPLNDIKDIKEKTT